MGMDCAKDMVLKDPWPILATALVHCCKLNFLRCSSTSLEEWYSEVYNVFKWHWEELKDCLSGYQQDKSHVGSLFITRTGKGNDGNLGFRALSHTMYYDSSIEGTCRLSLHTQHIVSLNPSIIVNDNLKKWLNYTQIQSMQQPCCWGRMLWEDNLGELYLTSDWEIMFPPASSTSSALNIALDTACGSPSLYIWDWMIWNAMTYRWVSFQRESSIPLS